MKKLILSTMMAALIPILASAQGTVSFLTSTPNHRIIFLIPNTSGFSAGLYWGALGTLQDNLVQLGAATGVNSITGYLINGGTRTTGPATAGGANATFQIRVWNGGAPSWESPWYTPPGATYANRTTLFTNPTGDPFSSPPGTPAQLIGWTHPIYIFEPPEPSSISLAALGFASLLMFRRRK